MVLEEVTPSGTIATITFLVLEASSQWLVGRNLTRYDDVRNIGIPCLVFQDGRNDDRHVLNTVEHNGLQYLSIQLFLSPNPAALGASSTTKSSGENFTME